MIFFTSDLHFYHEKIIRHCNRPFKNVDMMNEKLIANWNNIVAPDDEVYILGDVTMEGPEKAFAMLSQLKGVKYLIRGNHDRFADNEAWQQYSWVFRWVKDYHEPVWNSQKFVLFHYPVEEWADYYKGAIHLHGHQHNKAIYNYQQKQAGINRYDVGVDANGFAPVSLDTIMVFFK
ncbi:metallophosphoesterase [Succiniclasticum ruminis]|uniref:Calcineurin-like phosphoesterase superfamily protein n=1 Tax=Succiniclasticum ruminis DSM 9236 TaxID=1123323 RepID=A0A1I2D5F2_9FIRM|nr:metallophosphoesterase [Succiniclasticum ruminis]SFE75725.1 Calcineurin-like phosphoesterase superfamily protein [Succiniclasticum ruminis DSM 9236]